MRFINAFSFNSGMRRTNFPIAEWLPGVSEGFAIRRLSSCVNSYLRKAPLGVIELSEGIVHECCLAGPFGPGRIAAIPTLRSIRRRAGSRQVYRDSQDCPRSTNNEYEDLGHVTDARLNALRLQAGQFART
jgi:hypothetical protein